MASQIPSASFSAESQVKNTCRQACNSFSTDSMPHAIDALGLPTRCRNLGTFKMADLYCGGGGTSTAILEVADFLRLQCSLTVWNHWPVAIETHKTNHPVVEHFCEDLNNVNPRKHFKENELHCLWASPSCWEDSTCECSVRLNMLSALTRRP